MSLKKNKTNFHNRKDLFIYNWVLSTVNLCHVSGHLEPSKMQNTWLSILSVPVPHMKPDESK